MKLLTHFLSVVLAAVLTACQKQEGSPPPASPASPQTQAKEPPPAKERSEKIQAQKTQTIPADLTRDVLYIEHDSDGLEMFRVSKAFWNLKQTDGAWEFTVRVDSKEPLQRSEDLAEVITPEPNFEATAVLKPDELELKPGRVIVQQKGYDDARGINLSNYYYFHHSSVENVRIELLEVTKESILARVTGTSPEGDAKLAALTTFKRESRGGRSIQ